MKDVTHIERANVPWRKERETECGLDASKHPTWSRAETDDKIKELGVVRLSLQTCMTCYQTYSRHSTWDVDPASCVQRLVGRASLRFGRTPENVAIAAELRAIGVLVEHHRAEFDQLVADLLSAVDLQSRRAQKAARRRHGL